MHLLRSGQPRGQFLDLNLLPPAYRPAVFPLLGVALGLLAAVGVLLLLAIYQHKAAADAEVAYLQADLQQTQRRVGDLGQATPAGGGVQDVAALAKYRVGWSRVLQPIVASLPADVRLQDVSFATEPSRGPQAIVKGEAAEYAAVVEYADNLRSAALFSRVTIQSMSQTQVAPASGTVAAGRPAGEPASPAVLGSVLFPTRTPPTPQLVQPTSTPKPSPTPTQTPFGYLPPTMTATAGRTTPTPTATATSIAAYYNFLVAGKDQTCDMSAAPNASGDLVSGRVLDIDGSPMPGILVRVTSTHTDSPWSAETTTGSDGGFRFYLTKGTFMAEVVSGSSEVAGELWTRSTQEAGLCSWYVTFKKNGAATPVVTPSATPTITPTPTRTGTRTPWPTMTATPPPGTVLAGAPSASNNSAQAGLAIDNDTATAWNAGGGHYQYWQEIFATTYYVDGIGLVVTQNPDGNTTHIVHFFNATDAEISGSAVTFSGYTFEGQTLSHFFAPPIAGVKRVLVETTDSPSNVAWREVRVYTVGATPTASPTITGTPTPTATPTAIGEPDDTWQQAKLIGIDTPRVLTFYPNGDTDWLKFYQQNTMTTTYSVRAAGDAQAHPVIELDEYLSSSNTITLRGYWDSDSPCNNRPHDSVMPSLLLKPETTYYLRLRDKNGAAGTYTVTVHAGPLECPIALGPLFVTEVAAADPHPDGAAVGPPTSGASVISTSSGPGRGPGLAAPAPGLPALAPGHNPGAPGQVVSFTIILDVKSEGGP